jgi:hypothetical protein
MFGWGYAAKPSDPAGNRAGELGPIVFGVASEAASIMFPLELAS